MGQGALAIETRASGAGLRRLPRARSCRDARRSHGGARSARRAGRRLPGADRRVRARSTNGRLHLSGVVASPDGREIIRARGRGRRRRRAKISAARWARELLDAARGGSLDSGIRVVTARLMSKVYLVGAGPGDPD